MQTIILAAPFFLLLINYWLAIFFGVTIIFLLMRAYSAYICRAQLNRDTFLYVFFIPELITGPFRDYSDWTKMSKKERSSSRYKILTILNNIALILTSGYLYSHLIPIYENHLYKSAIIYGALYVQFSSISKIVNHISEFFGYKQIANFNHPLRATSISDFWTRWHVSLGLFSKKYINQPLTFYLGKRFRSKSIAFVTSVFTTFLFIGLWHNVSVSYFIFGAYFGVIVVIERLWGELVINFIKSQKRRFYLGIAYTQIMHLLGFSVVSEYVKNIIIHPSI